MRAWMIGCVALCGCAANLEAGPSHAPDGPLPAARAGGDMGAASGAPIDGAGGTGADADIASSSSAPDAAADRAPVAVTVDAGDARGATPVPAVPIDAAPAADAALARVRGKRHEWVRVPAGTFTMGSAPARPCRATTGYAETAHEVALTNPFEISVNEVTQAEFESALGYNPSRRSACPTCPVESIRWSEGAAYCNTLSADETAPVDPCYECRGTGRAVVCDEKPAYRGAGIYQCPGYRLPTEAEFEYAYRAGTTTDFYNGNITACNGVDPAAELIAIYAGNSGDRTHPVGSKRPNAWGLFDMGGNVWNLVNDRWVPDLGAAAVTNPAGATGATTTRGVRGGSYHYGASNVRAAHRNPWVGVDYTSPATGVRCVRTAR